MKFSNYFYLALGCLLLISDVGFSQLTYGDGPIELRVRVREIEVTGQPSDGGAGTICCLPDEYHFFLNARENTTTTWQGPGTGCLDEQFTPPNPSQDWNNIFYTKTFPGATVPGFFELKLDAWEDEWDDNFGGVGCSSNRCQFNTNFCCGLTLFGACLGVNDDDDRRCNADPFRVNMDYRQGSPCEWYNHGFIQGSCPANNIYEPEIESYWRYTKGDVCGGEIDLGTLPVGGGLSHLNSTECYGNSNLLSTGNDVYYKFTVTQPMGVTISLCGSATWNTNLYLMDGSCSVIDFNNNGCGTGNQSEIVRPICTPGTYVVVVDGDSPLEMGTFTLTINDNPNVLVVPDAGPDVIVCLGDSVPVGGSPTATNGQPPYTYSWTGLTGLSSLVVSNPNAAPTQNGSYFVTVTDGFGCSLTDTLDVMVETPPTAGLFGSAPSICSGDSLVLFASGGDTYTWLYRTSGSGFAAIAAGPVDTLVTNFAGQYAVVATDLSTGCTDTSAIVNLTVIPQPSSFISYPANDTFICAGENVLVVGSSGPSLIYEWLNNGSIILGAQNPFYNVASAGAYQLIVSVGGACPDTSSIRNVGINPAPVPAIVPAGNQQICFGDSLQMTASGGNFYQWYFNGAAIAGATNPVYFADQTGSYYADVVTDSGCVDFTLPVNLIVNSNPTAAITASGPVSLCPGQFVQLNGFGGGTYEWLESGVPIAGAISSNYFATAAGDYRVVVTNASSCRDTSSIISVVVNPNPTANIIPSGPTVFCTDDSLTLNATGGGTYQWRQNGVNLAGATSTSITTFTGGNFEVVVTSAAGCTDTSTIPVTVNQRPLAGFSFNGGPTICEGDSVILGASPSYMDYQWLFDGVPIPGGTDVFLTAMAPGDYEMVVTDPANGCFDTTLVFNLTFFPPDTVDIAPRPPLFICPGEIITLSAALRSFNGVITSYQWYYNDTLQQGASNSTYDAMDVGLFGVTVTDANGCELSDAIVIERDEDPNAYINLGGDIPVCDGEEILLIGGGGDTYLWLRDGNIITGATDSTLLVSDEGSYTLTATNSCGDDSATVSVPFFPGPGADFYWNPSTIYVGSLISFLDQSISAATWSWDFGDGTPVNTLQNPTHDFSEKGTYMVTLTIVDDAGCVDQITKEIEVLDLNDLLIPNVFTPNGDGDHDYFEIDWGGLDNVELKVFDRWGMEMFFTTATDKYWDGRYKQRDAPASTYFYTAQGRTPDGVEIIFHGNVSIIR